MFKEAKQIRKRKSERDHDDAVKFHKPEVGSSAATLGRGAAGLIGKTGGTLLTQYILKNHVSSCMTGPEQCLFSAVPRLILPVSNCWSFPL